jgi:membrane protein
MGALEYNLGQLLAVTFIGTMFFSLYKFLPNRRIRWRTALLAALFTSVMMELAKFGFAAYVRSFNPGSFYTGTVAALVLVVIWVYYAALIFILGGEVAQVYELRRVRKRQREAFED